MEEKRTLNINGTLLEKNQLKNHLEKVASSHNLSQKSKKETYPIENLKEDYELIKEVYELLNEDIKQNINIHPAGEWLLDNFYIIEETVKQIIKDMPLKKYKNLVGIANGEYEGFARIYVLAEEIVAYTENKIKKEDLEEYLKSYQQKKTLSMDEMWNIGIFLQIVIIKNIAKICEKIARSELQKNKVKQITQIIIEDEKNKEEINKKNIKDIKDIKDIKAKTNTKRYILKKELSKDTKYPFIEYMSYTLKKYGKKGKIYLKILEEIVEKLGLTVEEVIKKEHFDIAIQKVLIGNSITSLKNIKRINFLEIFEKINGVEEILKEDPANVYQNMDFKTKEYYRNKIQEISKKTKISEIYIAKKILKLAQNKQGKKSHIGYYLIDKGINELYQELKIPFKKTINEKIKVKKYISIITLFSIILDITITTYLTIKLPTNNLVLSIISFILFLIPTSEIIINIIQEILNKIVKPKLIPKMDYKNEIPNENKTMVVIPTILENKEKVNKMIEKLEIYYIANKSKNLYFTLLGDPKESNKEIENYDKDIIEEGNNKIKKLNQKYQNETPIFNFIYRKRIWNKKEEKYLGWERKRGMLNELNEYLLGNINSPFLENTIEKYKNETNMTFPKIKYIITLDEDTNLPLNSAKELIGAMSHILNKPIIDTNKNVVVDGYGIMQPRVGINLDISLKTMFTKIFAGAGGIDSYTNAISDIYQDNFNEGIFTGKGIYDLDVFSKVLKNEIPENKVLSHDLLEGSYLRCGLVSDIMLMDRISN